jgi:hypothetical protein
VCDLLSAIWVTKWVNTMGVFACRHGGKDFSVVFEALASSSGLLTKDQKEVAALRAENK